MIGNGISPSLGGGQSVLSKAVNQAQTILPLTTSLIASKGSNLTLTRADATPCATVVDFEGLVKVCKANEIRETGARRVENLCPSSEDFSNAAWQKGGTASVTGTHGMNFPAVSDYIQCNINGNVAGKTYVCTFTLSGAGTISIGFSNNIDYAPTVRVTLSTTPTKYSFLITFNGTVSSVYGCKVQRSSGDTSTVTCATSMMELVTGQSNQNPSEYVSSSESSTGALGVKFFQYANGNTVSNNVVSEATGTPLTTMKGLLTEPSRTNLVWPCGYGVAGSTQTTAALTAASYTLSFKGTGSVTGTGGWVGTLNGTGANNTVSMTVTATAAAATLTVTGSITEMQLELGANNSSVIPTTTAAVTRAADAATIPTSGNITAAAGTVYVEWTPIYSGGQGHMVYAYTDASNQWFLTHDGTSVILRSTVAGVLKQATKALALSLGTKYKIAGAWGATGFLLSVSGISGTSDPSTQGVVVGTVVSIADANPQNIQKNTKNLRTWTTQLSQAQLNALTR